MEITTEALQQWLDNHYACIAAGIRVGEIDQKKAQNLSLELIRRTS